MLRDDSFIEHMNDTEKTAWESFKETVENFLGNKKSENYKEIIAEMVENFRALGCNMNLKLHFLDSHIDYFPMNLRAYSEEQGERFHQDIKEIERRYQGRWDINMVANFCWNLKRETEKKGVKRKGNHSLDHFVINVSVITKKMSEKDALLEYGIKNCIIVKKQG